MSARFAFCLTAILALGCAETALVCGDGLVRDAEGNCVADPVDSGQPPVDAFVPTPDAGPCGGCSDDEHCRESDSTCVECLGDGDCSTGHCDLEPGVCVGCTQDGDCTQPDRARCDLETNMCAGCVESSECSRFDGFGVCSGDGSCVQCTTGSTGDTSACGGNPCTIDNVCSDFGEGEQQACEPCDTDANCQGDDYFCVPMEFKGEARGGYCLKSMEGGCTQPFGAQLISGRLSLSGEIGLTFCGVRENLTTCEAVRALLDNVQCSGGTDAECPEGGVCRAVGGFSNRCTYECQGAVQCPLISPADSCTAGTTPDGGTPLQYCGG